MSILLPKNTECRCCVFLCDRSFFPLTEQTGISPSAGGEESLVSDRGPYAEHHGRMKHVARRHFFIRECVENHQIQLPLVRTDENDADFHQKKCSWAQVLPYPLRNKIMNIADSGLDVPRSRGALKCDLSSVCSVMLSVSSISVCAVRAQ